MMEEEEDWLDARVEYTALNIIDRRRKLWTTADFVRRLRLLRCALPRLEWAGMDDLVRKAIELFERFADREAPGEELLVMKKELSDAAHWLGIEYVEPLCELLRPSSPRKALAYVEGWASSYFQTSSEIPHLARDIFGNPFRPVAFLPEWRTTTAVAIAQGMYDSRDFGPMPLLADALQDAGCEVPEIIDHCRGPGPHVRGCWVVDGVLGKT